MSNIFQLLTDPENQPHQYVGREKELIDDLFQNLEIKSYVVNNMLHGQELERDMSLEGFEVLTVHNKGVENPDMQRVIVFAKTK